MIYFFKKLRNFIQIDIKIKNYDFLQAKIEIIL